MKSNDQLALLHCWKNTARREQLPPPGDWIIWLFLGGRGAGKTRAGAEWIRAQVKAGARRIALVAPTYADGREVMVEGMSGLKNIGYIAERPRYEISRRRLVWPNGAMAYIFSAEDPDGLRGQQFDAAWADEFCAWSYPQATLSNLRFGLRLGEFPRLVMTSTPKPTSALRGLLQEPGIAITKASTFKNAGFLSSVFIQSIKATYGGTRLGRQELEGEVLDDMVGALWTRKMIADAFEKNHPPLDKTIIAIDPPVTSGEHADRCGIMVVGRAGQVRDAKAYVLHDGSVQGLSPERWARHAVALSERWEADYILVETNQGGEMVNSVFKAISADVILRPVYAAKSKCARAVPIATFYEQGRVKHIGGFPALEDELCTLGIDGVMGSKSPDRADALVWAVHDLLLTSRNIPSVRAL